MHYFVMTRFNASVGDLSSLVAYMCYMTQPASGAKPTPYPPHPNAHGHQMATHPNPKAQLNNTSFPAPPHLMFKPMGMARPTN